MLSFFILHFYLLKKSSRVIETGSVGLVETRLFFFFFFFLFLFFTMNVSQNEIHLLY